MDEGQFKARIAKIYNTLDAYTYYELLKVSQNSAVEQIRTSFHRLAISLHPDRYQKHPDPAFRQQIYDIYKRMAEAYRVLMKDETRRLYNEGLSRGERRLIQKERPRHGPKRVEMAIQNPQARKFFVMAQECERRGDKKNARINYKFAMDMEGKTPLLLERIQALDESE